MRASATVAMERFLRFAFSGELPVTFEFWDGSRVGPDGTSPGTVLIRSADAIRRILWAPGELGLSRAFVAGELEIDGDLFRVLRAMQYATLDDANLGWKAVWPALGALRKVGALGPPPPPPAVEARPRGRRHSKRRDASAISHHYDVGNAFYRLLLGPSLTYSCARFADPAMTLEQAQAAKHELIARKLGLHERPGMLLLDVGCGWGSMALHAAAEHEATVVGVTISRPQAELAQERVAAAGLTGKVEIRVQDYRDLAETGETFDAISSIGMFEHVGSERMAGYFGTLRGLLTPHGRLLNHAISSVGGSRIGSRTFIGRYVFPDGELIDVGRVVLAMEKAGFEVRDVETLREHYEQTLRHWVANLEDNWDEAVALVGVARARVWKLYLTASALGFADGGISVQQVLGVVPDDAGGSGLPPTRRDWT